jgi:starch-binding outer membrane protein, SusD/RagB family
MKKIIKYYTKIMALFLLGIVSVISCTKLEDKSYEEILTEGFKPTDEDVARIVGSAYGSWREILLFWDGFWRAQENCADEVITPPRPNGWVDGGKFRRMHRHTWTPDDEIVLSPWQRTYSGIADCNRIIYQIESSFLPLEEDVKKTTIAELKVLRASYYYVLIDLYGNVPIVTDFDVEEGYLPEQNTQQEVYDFITSEIEDNLQYLSREHGGVYYARFNQWAARTLLAKMYLNAEVYTGIPQWEKCIEQCDSIMANTDAGYGLEPNQKDVFVTENQNSIEIMFGIAIDDDYTTEWNTFDLHMQTLQPANQATYELTQTPWGGMAAIPQFINTFDPDDSRFTDNFITGQQYSSKGDSLMCTLGDSAGKPLTFINEVLPIHLVSQEVHGFRFGKFEYALGSSNIINNDYPLFRYADVLMMKAECLLRTGYADDAAELVTTVRERAFQSAPEKAVVTGDELENDGSIYEYGLRDEGNEGVTNEGGTEITYGRMLDELGWEFNQEGRRRQDMRRFGIFTSKSFLSHPAQHDDHTALYPIPRTILESNPNLTQNPGY